MAQKIKAQKEWPFYQAYHNVAYILRHDCSKDVPLREPKEKRLYRLLNNSGKEIVVYKIDGGIINNDEVQKCDNGIYTEDNLLILVELKGTDLDHALDQISSAINILLKQPSVKVERLNARIVLSKVRVPDMLSTKEKKLKQLLQKSYGGGDYKKKSQVLVDTI